MKNLGLVLKKFARHYSITKKTADIIKAFCSKENFAHKYQIAGLVSETKPVDWPKDLRKDDYYINEEGITELLVGSQQPPAKELAEYMGIEIIGNKYVHKEAGTIYTIQKVFDGEINETTVYYWVL